MHAVKPYKTSLEALGRSPGAVELAALDCEMIYTTSGSEVARVSVVGEDGVKLLDEYVRTQGAVLDTNVRFSGIQPETLEKKAVLDLAGTHKALAQVCSSETILIGHGLENDLKALRLVHDRVLDTAIVRCLWSQHRGRTDTSHSCSHIPEACPFATPCAYWPRTSLAASSKTATRRTVTIPSRMLALPSSSSASRSRMNALHNVYRTLIPVLPRFCNPESFSASLAPTGLPAPPARNRDFGASNTFQNLRFSSELAVATTWPSGLIAEWRMRVSCA